MAKKPLLAKATPIPPGWPDNAPGLHWQARCMMSDIRPEDYDRCRDDFIAEAMADGRLSEDWGKAFSEFCRVRAENRK